MTTTNDIPYISYSGSSNTIPGYSHVFYNSGSVKVIRTAKVGLTVVPVTLYWTDGIGAMGSTGLTGEKGANGSNGIDAYDLAIAGGFTGSEIEWIASLQGVNGASGVTTTQIVFATGSDLFSGATFALQGGNDDAVLNASGTYIPLIAKQDGQYLLSFEGIRNILLLLALLIGSVIFILKVSQGKKGL